MPSEPGRRWRVRPGAAADSLAALDADWERLEELPGARVLKSNPLRAVIALPAAGGRPAVVAKRYHVRGTKDRLVALLRPSRARREWRALLALEAAGLPTPRPLGWFERRRGAWLAGAGLVMERLEGVEPLPGLLASPAEDESDAASRDAHGHGSEERSEGAVLRRLRATGALVARLHRAGIAHPDLHLGNFLGAPGDPDDVRLVDLHAVVHRRRVGAARVRRDLAKLVHSLGEQATGAPRARAVLAGYLAASGTAGPLADLDAELARILRLAREVERVRLASRDRRCFATTSQFVAERGGGWRIHRRRTLPLAVLARLIDGSALPRIAAGGRARAEIELATPAGPRVFAVDLRERGALSGLLDRLRRGPLARAWGAARRLEVRGIPHARAEALLSERRGIGGLLSRREVLVTERIPGRTLEAEVRERAATPRELERFLRRAIADLAPLLARLHEGGIRHGDLGAAHWLVVGTSGGERAPPGSFIPLALDVVPPRGAPREAERRRHLVDLALLPLGAGALRRKARFLRDYRAALGSELRRGELRALLRALEPEWSRRRIARIEALAAAALARPAPVAVPRAVAVPGPERAR